MISVDSSFWIAQALPQDRRHPAATRLTKAYARARLATSTAVRAERWAFLRVRTWRVRDRLARHAGKGSRGDRAHRRRARGRGPAWLRVHDERPYSSVDATSFAHMRTLRIREALAFDGDFEAAGFVELRP